MIGGVHAARYHAVMKWVCFTLLALATGSNSAAAEPRIGADCTFRGHSLKGRVQIVESFPDIRVRIVDSFPDLKVKRVESFPDDCGEWLFVESFPDFRIQLVSSFADIDVRYVDSFPGLP